MFTQKDELIEHVSDVLSMEEYASSLSQDDITLVFRDYDEPTTAPYLSEGVEVFDFNLNKAPADLKNPYGSKGNISGVRVVNAIRNALGYGGYCLHMSDRNYTQYTIWELNDFMTQFDNTDLRVWIAETFDCDDFSQVLQGHVNGFFPGIAFGTLWYGPNNPPWWGHSVNIFYSYTHDRVFLVEPQNDVFYTFNRSLWRPWMVIL